MRPDNFAPRFGSRSEAAPGPLATESPRSKIEQRIRPVSGSDAGRLKRFEKDARSIRNDGEPLLAPRFRQSVIEGHERKLCRSVFGGNEQGSELQCIRGPQRVNTQ